ncbi:MAG: DNA replication/repair protein RecF [Bacteroidales bacterium]|nr:DNA replication/repair protein RecF [Bacteroidales bacterium]
MAILDRIVVQDFRNISLAELRFSPKVNCISGNNGEGKTNLMDAIWYLSMTKSAFSSSDRFNFRHGRDSFSIAGTYVMDNGTCSKFAISVSDGGEKKLRRDDKPYGKISEHIGILPIVMVSPSDTALVSESGEERRKFLNAVLSQMDRKYLSDVQQYNRLLLQRNRELKSHRPDIDLLKIFDARMSAYAGAIHEARARFTADLNPVVSRYYELISGGREEVSIRYSSDLDRGDLESLLAASREKDLVMKFTTVGVQRDDLSFMMGDHPIRKCGSQGQQKSFLVALKFAQYELMKEGYGFPPILLLDDVFDKLDMGRISNLLAMVAGQDFGQIFITDSNKVRLSGIVDGITMDRAYFDTVAGSFTPIGTDGTLNTDTTLSTDAGDR